MSGSLLEFEDAAAAATPAKRERKPKPSPAAEPERHPADEELEREQPPAPVRQAPKASRMLPHSLEAEENLLSSCFIDGATVIRDCLRAQLSHDSFYDPKHAIIFSVLVDLYHRNAKIIDPSVVAEELKKRRQLDAAGGYPFLTQVSSRIPTTAHANYFLESVRGYALRRLLIKLSTGTVEECYNPGGDIDDLISSITAGNARVIDDARKEIAVKARGIMSYGYPEGDDPNILLGTDDYLGRGGGMLLVSHAGAGKSSIVMDACMTWALGRPFAGIKCNGPLKSLIIQAEDSDRYVGKVSESFASACELSDAERRQVDRNVQVVRVSGITGSAFFSELERLVTLHSPDLVAINPIYLYAEGDISKSEHAQPFLVGLDRVNREMRFGYILVHHTGKPQQKDGRGKRAEVEDWETIYMGFGSSYLANWPRCSALLEPKAGSPGRYFLKLGKGGVNAGVTKSVPVQEGMSFRLEPTTRIAMRHSTKRMQMDGRDRQVIFWELDEDSPATSVSESKGGRPSKYNFSDYAAAIRHKYAGSERRQGFSTLWLIAHAVDGISKTQFRDLLREAVERGEVAKSADGRYYIDVPSMPASPGEKR